jgi:predicted small lipoprotein YifL
VAIGLGLLLLTACGQKGPLYLPTSTPAPSGATITPETQTPLGTSTAR